MPPDLKGIKQMKFNYLVDFLKNHTENVMEKLVSDSFLENQNETYL